MRTVHPVARGGLLLALLFGAAGCSASTDTTLPTEPTSSAAPAASSNASGGTFGAAPAQPGAFTAGTARISSPSGQATLDFSEGLYVSANDSVVANFADGDTTDPNTNALGVNGSASGLSATLIGPLQPQGVSTECTVTTTRLEPTGLAGSFECDGGVTGTFEAH